MKKHQILAHRGMWTEANEKNTQEAVRRALNHGFGLETDVRDFHGELVITHDPPEVGGNHYPLEWVFDHHTSHDCAGMLALNIKADGLASAIRDLASRYNLTKFFVFDMSVPDTLSYLSARVPVYTRLSEYEPTPPLVDRSSGIWLDAFTPAFPQTEALASLCGEGRAVAIVSPELHGRDHEPAWVAWRPILTNDAHTVFLCTDFPESANAWFGIGHHGD